MCVLQFVWNASWVRFVSVWDSFGMHFKMFEVREKCD